MSVGPDGIRSWLIGGGVARMLEDEERRRHDPYPPMVERERAPVPVTLAGYDRARVTVYEWWSR